MQCICCSTSSRCLFHHLHCLQHAMRICSIVCTACSMQCVFVPSFALPAACIAYLFHRLHCLHITAAHHSHPQVLHALGSSMHCVFVPSFALPAYNYCSPLAPSGATRTRLQHASPRSAQLAAQGKQRGNLDGLCSDSLQGHGGSGLEAKL